MSTGSYHPDDASAITAQIVSLAQANLPLETGLRAAAAESSNARIARALAQIAQQLETGESLEQALANATGKLPGNIAALLVASRQSGKWREALLDVVEHDLSARETLRTVRMSLAYPLALLAFAYLCLLFVMFALVGRFAEMINEFQLDLPRWTTLLYRLYDVRWWLVVVPCVLAILVGLVLPLCLGAVRWNRLLATVPFAGPMWHWCGVAQATRALAYLVDQQLPLANALRASASGLRDANVADAWQRLAEQVEVGQSLSYAISQTHRLPASLVPLVQWGERTGSLGEALRGASDYLEGRVRLRAQMLRMLLPPLLFILIGSGALFVVVSLLAPMFTLLQFFMF